MGNPDDIHGFEKGYSAALKRLRMAQFFKKDLDTITEMDFDDLIDHLKEKGMVDYNYRKITKKFFRWLKDDDVPKWVKEELDKLLNACTHPRDKALIAVAFDSMMRIGALGTLKVKSPVHNEFGAVLYMSGTSKNLKTTTPRPVPLTWSTGFLNQWLSIHPCKDDPEAPLWVNIRGRDRNKAMSYNTLRKTLKSITERAGVKKRIFFHLFRHMKVTDMLLKGFPTQQIEYQAGWDPGSRRMLRYTETSQERTWSNPSSRNMDLRLKIRRSLLTGAHAAI
jgi:integrase/recombinase XerD